METKKGFVDLFRREGFLIKNKFEDLFERFSFPALHLEWRAFLESILLMLLSLAVYESVIFTQFSFVPIMIIAIKRGWKEAVLYLTVSLAVLYYMMVNGIRFHPFDDRLLLFSPVHFTLDYLGRAFGVRHARFFDYYILFGGLGIFIGHLISKNYKLSYVIFSSLLMYVGIIIFILGLSSMIGGVDRLVHDYYSFVENDTQSYVAHSFSQFDGYRDFLLSYGIDYDVLEKRASDAVHLYKRSIFFEIAPKGGYLLKQVVTIFLSILFVKLYFKKRLQRAAFFFDIKKYRIDDDWVWGLIASWGLVYINLYLRNSFLGIVGWNFAVIISFLFFLRGLSVLKFGADKLGMPEILQYTVFLFLLFYSFVYFTAAVVGIGVMDIWLRIREHIQNINKRERA